MLGRKPAVALLFLGLILLPSSHAGLDAPAHRQQAYLQYRNNPCSCPVSADSLRGIHPLSSTDCGDKTVYKVSWGCVAIPKPRPHPSSGPPPPCPCSSSFLASVRSSCYKSFSTCTYQNRTYFTASLLPSPALRPVFLDSGPFVQAPCPAHSSPSVVCWGVGAPIYVSDGGGPQDQARQNDL